VVLLILLAFATFGKMVLGASPHLVIFPRSATNSEHRLVERSLASLPRIVVLS
jgi:hypothetical protein